MSRGSRLSPFALKLETLLRFCGLDSGGETLFNEVAFSRGHRTRTHESERYH